MVPRVACSVVGCVATLDMTAKGTNIGARFKVVKCVILDKTAAKWTLVKSVLQTKQNPEDKVKPNSKAPCTASCKGLYCLGFCVRFVNSSRDLKERTITLVMARRATIWCAAIGLK